MEDITTDTIDNITDNTTDSTTNNTTDDIPTSKYLTSYELAVVLGKRAIQIECGGDFYVDVSEFIVDGILRVNPLIVADMEIKQKRSPMKIDRRFNDGTVISVRVNDLEINPY